MEEREKRPPRPLLPLPPPRPGGRRSGCGLSLALVQDLDQRVDPGHLLSRAALRRNVQERQELLLQRLPPVPPLPLLLLPHLGLLLLLHRQRSGRQEGERGPIDGFTCRPSQRGQGESRHALARGVPPAAVTPLRPGLREVARPLPRRWCLLSPQGVLRNLHHLLLGPGCLRSPWGGVVRSFSQGHSDGHPLVAMPLTEPSLQHPC